MRLPFSQKGLNKKINGKQIEEYRDLNAKLDTKLGLWDLSEKGWKFLEACG